MEYKFNQKLNQNSIQGRCIIQNKEHPQETLYESCAVSLIQIMKFKYQILIQDKENCLNQKTHNLQENFQAYYKPDYEQKVFIFYFPISNCDLLIVVCKIQKGQEKLYEKFRELYCRCVYQQKNKEQSTNFSREDMKEKLFKYIKKLPGIHDQISVFQNILQNQQKQKQFFLEQIVVLQQMDLQNAKQYFQEYVLVYFKQNQDFTVSILIKNKDNKIINEILVNDKFHYYLDIQEKALIWTSKDQKNQNSQVNCLYFETANDDYLQKIKNIIDQSKDYKYQNFVLKDEINQSKDYKCQNFVLKNDDIQNIQIFQNAIYQEPYIDEDESDEDCNDVLTGSSIVDFQQLKQSRKLMLARKDGIQILSQQNLSSFQNYKIFDSQKNCFIPSNIHIFQDNQKFISKNYFDSGKAYHIDLPSQKIIKEYKNSYQNAIVDLSIFNEKEMPSQNLFLTLGRNNIELQDVRCKQPARVKKYASIYDFSHIFSPSFNNFITVTEYGELRCYDEVGNNAKNKLDKFGDDLVQHLDSNRSGDLILVTFNNKLYLYPMNQGCYNAFKYTMKYIDKPKPFNLQINQQKLIQFGVSEFRIKSAKFDEKSKGKESQIIAILEPDLIAFWNLEQILKNGKVKTDIVKKLDEEIVKGEFLYNTSDVITVSNSKIQINQFNAL